MRINVRRQLIPSLRQKAIVGYGHKSSGDSGQRAKETSSRCEELLLVEGGVMRGWGGIRGAKGNKIGHG